MSTDTQPPSGGKIHPAIIAIMRSVGAIAKDQRNTQQNFNYRGIDQVYNAVHPHFAEHGVYSTSAVLHAEHRVGKSEKGKEYIHAILRMRFTFWAEDGSHVHTEVVGEGVDYSGDKASNKAMSVADKYAILQLLKIPTAMVDPDREPYGAPPRADRPATAPPRGKRMTPDAAKEKVGFVYREWINQEGADVPEGERKEAFQRWVCENLDLDRYPAPSGWTVEHFDRLYAALGAPTSAELYREDT